MGRYHISGVPITDEAGKLVGILTNRDTRFIVPGEQPVSDFMTSQGLVTASVGTTLEEAKEILHLHRIEKLPLVDEAGYLKGLITVKDILKKLDFPNEATDEGGDAVNSMMAVFTRELRSSLRQPVVWFVAGAYLTLHGIFFTQLMAGYSQNSASILAGSLTMQDFTLIDRVVRPLLVAEADAPAEKEAWARARCPAIRSSKPASSSRTPRSSATSLASSRGKPYVS